MQLALSTLPPDEGPTTDIFLFLHGILGSGANWRGFAKRLLAGRRGVEGWLVDLRMHGRSLGFAPPHTVAACAADLARLVEARGARVSLVLGHSFGGKVALAYAAAHPEHLRRVFVVDSNPGPRPDARGSETTLTVLELLRKAPPAFASRDAFTAHFVEAGLDRGVVAWLAMNLAARDGAFVFRIDLDAVDELLRDYLALDLFPFVEAAPPSFAGKTVLIAGGRSQTLDANARRRVSEAAALAPTRVALEVIPDAGHWVHVDAPEALQSVVARHL